MREHICICALICLYEYSSRSMDPQHRFEPRTGDAAETSHILGSGLLGSGAFWGFSGLGFLGFRAFRV